MFRTRRLVPSLPMLVALVAVFLAGGGRTAYAAASNFLLNTSNTATAATQLDGSAVAGKALQITNTNTANGATALGLNVASGHPPFAVNSKTKVAKLNTDLLDGIDSTGFVQGPEHMTANRTSLTVPNGSGAEANVLTIPGVGHLDAGCSGLQQTADASVALDFTNTSGQDLDLTESELFASLSGSLTDREFLFEAVVPNTGGTGGPPSDVGGAGQGAIIHAEFQIGTGVGAASHLTTIIATATMTGGSLTCVASAQAITMP